MPSFGSPVPEKPYYEPIEVVVFTGKDLPRPDTLLEVLNVDFHVHSTVLKMHSAFFAKFLDSPDKAAHDQGKFKYEWITEFDVDDPQPSSWSLVSRGNSPDNLERNLGNHVAAHREDEVGAFQILLRAFYNKEYTFKNIMQLGRAVELADYYCALPTLSRSIDGVFRRGPVPRQPIQLLKAAAKLRHVDLFRDCICWIAGNWSNPSVFKMHMGLSGLDSTLKAIIMKARIGVKSKIVQAQCDMLNTPLGPKPVLEAISQIPPRAAMNLPSFYRAIHVNFDLGEWSHVQTALRPLLKNNMVLAMKDEESGSYGEFEAHFLCAEIADEDIPWPMYQKDW